MDVRVHDAEKVVDRWDDVFEALSAEPRRQLVVSLLDAPPDATVALPGAATNPRLDIDREHLATALYHRHLPLLEAHSFVEWTADPLAARPGRRFDEVGAVFDALHGVARDLPASLTVGCERLENEQRADRTP